MARDYDNNKYLAFEFDVFNPKNGTTVRKTGFGTSLSEAMRDVRGSVPSSRRITAISDNPIGQKVQIKTKSAGKRSTSYEIVPIDEQYGTRIVDRRTPEDIRMEQAGTTPIQLANRGSRLPGESIADFTKRLDAPLGSTERTNQLLGGDYFDVKTGAQIKEFTPSSGSKTQTGGTPSGGTSGDSQGTSGSGSGYSPVVGTSFAERYKELQKELGLGKAPTAPDYFTDEDKTRLGTARDERTAIEAEMAAILDERLAIDEELQKFGINAGEGTTEAGRIGAVSEAQRNANERLMVLNRRELVLETKLRSRNTVISELMGLQKEDYANAVEQYNTQFSRAMQLYAIFDEEQDEARADAKAEKNELKTSAKANLDVLSNAYQKQIESGQITQLSGLQQARLEELETQAGLPIGSTMAVLSTLKPSEEKIYTSFNEKTGQLQYFYRDANGNMGVRTSQGSPTSSNDSSTGGSSVAITPEDRRTLTGAGFSQAEITQIVSDVNRHGIDAVLAGTSGAQKTAIQKVFGATKLVTREQVSASVTQKLAQEGLESAYTMEELEKLAAQYGFASIWKSREAEVESFLNSSKAKEVYADLLYKQYKDAGQAE